MATLKQATALMDLFQEYYIQKYSMTPMINRVNEKWTARDLITSFGVDDCNRAVKWYFKVSPKHDWKVFARICGDLITNAKAAQVDEYNRSLSRKLADEWRNH